MDDTLCQWIATYSKDVDPYPKEYVIVQWVAPVSNGLCPLPMDYSVADGVHPVADGWRRRTVDHGPFQCSTDFLQRLQPYPIACAASTMVNTPSSNS